MKSTTHSIRALTQVLAKGCRFDHPLRRQANGMLAVSLLQLFAFFPTAILAKESKDSNATGAKATIERKGTDTGQVPVQEKDSTIDAAAVLRGVRESQAAIQQSLQGKLRMGPRKLPYRMTMNGGELRFEFPESQPPDPRVVSLQFGDREAVVKVQAGEGTQKRARFEDEILGMNVLYEDLAMRYLYWSDAVVEGEERVLPPLYVRCWKIRVKRPPSTNSVYKEVLVWVSQENGGILKSEAYDDGGNLVRRLKVISIQGSDAGTTLKQMRIESPLKTGASFVYLDVDGLPEPKTRPR